MNEIVNLDDEPVMRPRRPRARRRPLPVAILLMAALLIGVAGWIAYQWHASLVPPPPPSVAAKLAQPKRVVPQAELPTVEPVEFIEELGRDQARAINAKVPFVKNGVVMAKPFRFAGTPVDRDRAVACLAVAMLYEAGDDPLGQRSVAQVVLNRVRHPAYPKTVCGVVFQGAERATGCQFTFTCDGALTRPARPAALLRAEQLATWAISGGVDPLVGHATHYHTNWVVPYWSASLDKIAQVRTHLFFRWTGWWGTPRAFTGHYNGGEPIEPKIAALFPAHLQQPTDAGLPTPVPTEAVAAAPAGAASGAVDDATLTFSPTATNADFFLVTLPKTLSPQRYEAVAQRACAARSRCIFMGWIEGDQAPKGLPASTSQLQSMAFHYLRDPALPAPRVRWNCSLTPRDDHSQCLSHQGG